MGIIYTPEQQQVIELHNRNILVSAAAGSGKTAVLVERIIHMISRKENPVDIDRLLIVTFTNAAAAEMRERIGIAIAKRLEQEPESEHLQKQATLIHNAQITTIDSFCLFVIRNNFNDIGLDPGFRIADEGELKLLQQDVLGDLLEDKFQEKSEDFLYCVEYYCAGGKETVLEKYILYLYQLAMSYPWPEAWLEERKQDYDAASIEEMENTPLIRFLMENLQETLHNCVEKLHTCQRICLQPDGPYMYEELIEQEAEQLSVFAGCQSLREFAAGLEGVSFGRLSGRKDDAVSSEKRERVKVLRTEVKERIQGIRDTYFATPLPLAVEQGLESARAVKTLIALTMEFKQRLDAGKREKNIIDFGDMEHFALNILVHRTENGCEATKTALEYREYFKEILIDEYQDSNLVQEYLLKAVSREEAGDYNRFMVGDVKQSIYKFRLARPELFMEKFHSYTTEEGKKQRIDLHKNFRSREEVIESVNYICRQIMGRQLGGVAYEDDSALYLGASYPPLAGSETELILMEKPEKDSHMNAKELEAYGIARRIHELMRTHRVTDKETGELRKVRYGDIVILLRTNSGWDEEFKKVFTKQGIPSHMVSKTGYFATTEIQDMIQFLRVLDNPLQDIPLFGTLKSMFGGFTEEEIAIIRSSAEGLLYHAVTQYASEKGADVYSENKNASEGQQAELESADTKALQEKCNRFLQMVDRYRDMTVYMPIRQLIQTILTEFEYLAYVTALPLGEQRKANVEMLLQKAGDFEQTSYFGLFHFIRYMEQLEKYDVDYGEADILHEHADVVRIMSIHKSKGLEFPITFVAGLSKRFNMQDTTQSLLADMDMGIGTDYVDPVRRIQNKTLRKNIISRKMQLDNLGEELRILYVALTRAKEKLILTGILDKPEEKLASLSGYLYEEKELLSFTDLSSARSAMDFILPALIRHRAMQPLWEQLGIQGNPNHPLYTKGPDMKISIRRQQDIICEEVYDSMHAAWRQMQLQEVSDDKAGKVDKELYEMLQQRFSYRYTHENLQELYTKTTVSELKKAAMEEKGEPGIAMFEEPEIVPYIPKFMAEKETISGTTRGSAFHKTLELMDFARIYEQEEHKVPIEESLGMLLEQWEEEGRLTKEYKEAVSIRKLTHFLQSELAHRMYRADRKQALYREQPFVYGIAANRLNTQFPEEETVLIQGIIDVFFEEEGEIILVDYKTDTVQRPEELIARYRTQLDYYEEALRKLTQKPVKERILYSFSLEQEIRL